MAMTNKERLQKHNAELAECVDYVSGKGPRPKPVPIPEKDVNFYEYDGTLLHSYTVEEAQGMTELPPLPTQPGLICQGWNYDLETIKAHNRALNIGATYITDDGKTRLYIKIAAEGRMDVPLYFSQTVANGVTIDWGDGSATETLSGTGKMNTTHTYASIGEYIVTLDPADGCTLGFGADTARISVMGSTQNIGQVYCSMLQKVEIGKGVTSIGSNAFVNSYSLTSIVIPNSVTSIATYAFRYCHSINSIVIPNSVTSMAGYPFECCYSLARIVIPNSVKSICRNIANNCYSLTSIVIPNSATSISTEAFSNCYSLASIVIPNSVKSIASSAFYVCIGMKFYDFSQHKVVPTLGGTNAFSSNPSDCEIRVPMALVDEWKAATNWSTYADKIVGV